jgi:ribulose-bisphosphate carboxylase large chain
VTDVIATYSFRPRSDTRPEEAALAICEEETTGTLTGIPTRADYVKRFDGEVISLTPLDNGYVARIRYPVELFEPGNIAQYLSVVAGNLFSLSQVEAVRLMDIEYPDQLVSPFRGPKFGISGLRRLIGTKTRPHVGTIIKPKVGLTPEDTAAVAYRAAIGGVDLVIDDETLTDQAFCPIEKRVPAVMNRLAEAKDETGQEVLYAVNISTRADRIVERALHAIDLGANMIMVDVFTTGFGALQALAEDQRVRVPVHVHRTMHGAFTRNPEHGIAMRPLAQIIRWLGADQFYTGTVSGKMIYDEADVKAGIAAITCNCHAMKRTLPVSSGGIHPGNVAHELEVLGTDIVIQAGSGIHNHPDGTTAGTRAMRQAVDAFIEGKTAEEYAKDHYELERALERWGSS